MSCIAINSLSPLDGRYADLIKELRPLFSEFSLIKNRVFLEIKWLLRLAEESNITELSKFKLEEEKFLESIVTDFSEEDAKKIKQIENDINHDIKACEYFLKEKFKEIPSLNAIKEFIHFALTSEDINNLAYGLILKQFQREILLPNMRLIVEKLKRLAHEYARQPMLARTHGKKASPTTVGKEFANFASRLEYVCKTIEILPISGKCNGAVGNFNAHEFVYPQVDWRLLAQSFVVDDLGLNYNEYTTQIEPHDRLADFCDQVLRFNTILLDLNRDVWGYIALGFFQQKVVTGEVGSSVMPHKINPIHFENSEGNLGLANSLLRHFSEKLPISRWQRDLSDSTVLRNLGVAFGYTILAFKMLFRGLTKIEINVATLNADLDSNWEVLAEPVQTMMRRFGIENSYEKLKKLTRGEKITKEIMHDFIRNLDLPQNAKEKLLELSPKNYLGKACELAEEI